MNWPWILVCGVGVAIAFTIVRSDWKVLALFAGTALVLEFYGLAWNLSGGVSMDSALWLNDLDFERRRKFSLFLILGHGFFFGLIAGVVVKGIRLARMRTGVQSDDA